MTEISYPTDEELEDMYKEFIKKGSWIMKESLYFLQYIDDLDNALYSLFEHYREAIPSCLVTLDTYKSSEAGVRAVCQI